MHLITFLSSLYTGGMREIKSPNFIFIYHALEEPGNFLLDNLGFIVIIKVNSLLTSPFQLHILRNQEYYLDINTLLKILLPFLLLHR